MFWAEKELSACLKLQDGSVFGGTTEVFLKDCVNLFQLSMCVYRGRLKAIRRMYHSAGGWGPGPPAKGRRTG